MDSVSKYVASVVFLCLFVLHVLAVIPGLASRLKCPQNVFRTLRRVNSCAKKSAKLTKPICKKQNKTKLALISFTSAGLCFKLAIHLSYVKYKASHCGMLFFCAPSMGTLLWVQVPP